MADTDLVKTAQDLEAEAAALEAKAANAPDTDVLVDKWLAEYFPASMITRNSAGWQHFLAAAAELKRRLKGA